MTDSEFKPFIERRERIEAFRFMSAQQAPDVARALGADDFEFHYVDHKLHMVAKVPVYNHATGHTSYTETRVNQGDFIARPRPNGWAAQRAEVVPQTEFGDLWEADK